MNITTLEKDGFEIKENIYSDGDINAILNLLKQHGIEEKFGVREILNSIPELSTLIFNEHLLNEISKISNDAFIVKSIFFDKPPQANWIVNWHQDLTINLSNKKRSS